MSFKIWNRLGEISEKGNRNNRLNRKRKKSCSKIFKNICKEKEIDAIFLDVDDIRRNILNEAKIDRVQLNKKIYNDEKAMKEYKKYINPKIKKYLSEQIRKNNVVIFIEWAYY